MPQYSPYLRDLSVSFAPYGGIVPQCNQYLRDLSAFFILLFAERAAKWSLRTRGAQQLHCSSMHRRREVGCQLLQGAPFSAGRLGGSRCLLRC